MDRWESAIEDLQKSQTLDSYGKVLLTAEGLLKEDLAPFEFDWFVQTLLSAPVCLLAALPEWVCVEARSKLARDAYHLLEQLVRDHYDRVETYFQDIVAVCERRQGAGTRAGALRCLAACARRDLPCACAHRHVAELAQAAACKAPLAILVGAICEHHPEMVADKFIVIWRNYLNLLTTNKNTDKVCEALLKGVWGLLKHFGADIPVRELSELYDSLARDYLTRCTDAALAILRDYAALFQERIAADAELRRALWTCADLSAMRPVYRATAAALTAARLQDIVNSEIVPRTLSESYKVKFTALRIACSLQRAGRVARVPYDVDVYALEYQLRGAVSHETAEALSWCLEANVVNSEKLLQTAIMFYANLPASRRKDIVVQGLLDAPLDVMHVTLNFLVTETCQSEASLLTHLPFWRDVMESKQTDNKIVFLEMYIDNLLLVLDNYLDDDVQTDDKEIPEKLSTLLSLTGHIFDLSPEVCARELGGLVAPRVAQLARAGLTAPLVALLGAIAPYLEGDQHVMEVYEMVHVERCADEALLCAACLALTRAPPAVRGDSVLGAIEIILTRNDAEPTTLSMAIEKLETLIIKKDSFDKSIVSKCVRYVEKLRLRKDMVGKHARILQRDVTMFLGKYLNLADDVDSSNAEDNMLIVKLRDELTLDLPNPVEGLTYKINLHRLLHLAIANEHEHSLRMLLNIICAKLCNGPCPVMQAALGRALTALCRTTRRAPPAAAPRHCAADASAYILQQMSTERSPAVRRLLSELVEAVLLREPGSAASETQLVAAHGEAAQLLSSRHSVLKLGGLEITESLLSALKVNRYQTQALLPSLAVLISKTHEQESSAVLENATKLFIENIGLFNAKVLDSTTEELLRAVLDKNWEVTNTKVYKNTVKVVLSLARDVTNYTKESTSKITRQLFDLQSSTDTVKFVYVLTEIPKYFELCHDDIKQVLDCENGLVLDSVFEAELEVLEDAFALETHLRFINQFAAVLFKFHSQRTLKHLSSIIDRLPPKYVGSQKRHLSECLTHCRQMLHSTPDCLLRSFENWSEGIPLKDITEHAEKEKFSSDHALAVSALERMLDIFQLKNPTAILTTVSIFAKEWANVVLRIYASGHVKYFKKHVPYLSDLLSISLRFLTVTDVKNIILDGNLTETRNERVGIEFCKYFMTAFFKHLVRKPFLMLQQDMEPCCTLLNDVVKCSARQRWRDEQVENVLELVDQLWPTYEQKASFKQKHSLLLMMRGLRASLPPASRPMRWATELIASGDAEVDDKIAIVAVLPGEDAYSETYRRYASLLPTRLSDMNARCRAALRALLEAVASGALSVLDILITLADGDDTAGWWDEAFDSCMASVAALPSMTQDILSTVYSKSLCSSPTVCSRLLIPLLRYSPPSVCEQFFARSLQELLEGLRGGLRAPSAHPEYRACVRQKTVLVDMLQVLFERVPAEHIESPSSPLYEHIQTDKPWHAAREVIQVCFRLRGKLLPPADAPSALQDLCRAFQQSAFKCMCGCICVRRPEAAAYGAVWDERVWARLVSPAARYDLPLRASWHQRTVRTPVSIRVERAGGARSRTVRTRSRSRAHVFLRTLSENPLEYDFIEHAPAHAMESVEVEMPDNPLSREPCAGTLTALFAHAAGGVQHAACRRTLRAALLHAATPLRYLLAQAVCNCKEELKQYASELRPALLAVVADEARADGGPALLNSLHIDILNTLIHWDEDVHLPTPSHLSDAVASLVHTALENCTTPPLFRTLEAVLAGVLNTYGALVQGDFGVFARSFDDPNRTKSCLKLLLCFAKHKVPIPGLLPALLTKLSDNHKVYGSEMSPLAELIGLQIANSSPQGKAAAGARLKRILEEVKKNSVSDYVKIVYHSMCCDAQQLRAIVDLTLKLPEPDRRKCLRIVCTYLREHPGSPEAADMPANIRDMADDLYGDMNFEELFSSPPQGAWEPRSAKRLKTETCSRILSTIGMDERRIGAGLARLGRERVARLAGTLCTTRMAVRLAECFYLCIYLPVRYPGGERADLPVCLAEFLDLLFSHLKQHDTFKQKKLREEPCDVEHAITGSVRTRTKRMAGTLRAFSYDAGRYAAEDTAIDSGIDVQVTIDKILDSLIQFAKVTPSACTELVAQLVRLLGTSRGFDSRPVVARLVSTALGAAPALVLLARECCQELSAVDGFADVIEGLCRAVIGSEGERVCRLLLEETNLRSRGDEQFALGNAYGRDVDDCMTEHTEFSIENMVSAFHKLSNWDELPLEDRRHVEAPDFPPLWTDRQQFTRLLDQYTDTRGWFGQMVALFRGDRQNLMKWLRAADRWPRNNFALASVIEAMQWHSVELDPEEMQMSCDIDGADCLAEWAARLMLRSAYLTEKCDSEATRALSRSHELVWCRSANERGLHEMALAVVRRNCLDDLYEGETLQWMEQKLVATAALASRQNDLCRLAESLGRAEELAPFYALSPPQAVIGVNAILTKIHYKLQSLSSDKMENIMCEVEVQVRRLHKSGASCSNDRNNLRDVLETAVSYYDGLWDGDECDKDAILLRMSSCVGRAGEWNTDGASVAAVLLNRLAECRALGDGAAATLLATMKRVIPKLPPCYSESLKETLPLLPARAVRAAGIAELLDEPAIEKLKLCLQLLCHADHLLLQYCEELYAAISDDSKWSAVYERMVGRVFQNEWAGPEYQALAKYRGPLDTIRHAEGQTKRLVLKGIMQELRAGPGRATVRLSHVCPALGAGGRAALGGLGALLGLPAGVEVVKIEDELSVFSDSVRRPCVMRVRDSNGRLRRYLHKNESLLAHAAITHCHDIGDIGYKVIPLSEDCGLIEFLEDHKRIRDLIASTCQIDDVSVTRQAAKDDELILAPMSASVQSYHQLCSKIPAYSLRSAIENHCVSVEDFIAKKRRFENTLSDVTVTCWLFGLGDRHLHNLLYSIQDGGVRCVDWGAIFHYGAAELPPARLTRNLLAVTDTTVLRSRLQSRVAALRDTVSRRSPILRLAFRRVPEFHEKFAYINGIMRGTMVAQDIMKDSLRNSAKPHKTRYIELMDAVFRPHRPSPLYSVEDQVSCLLRACTEPAILGVTRSGWEPWL